MDKKQPKMRKGMVTAGGGRSITPRQMPVPARVYDTREPIGRARPTPQPKREDPGRIKLPSVRERERQQAQEQEQESSIVTPAGVPFRRGLAESQVAAAQAAGVPSETCPRCGDKFPPSHMRQIMQAVGGSGGIRVCIRCVDESYKDPKREGGPTWQPQREDVGFDDQGRPIDTSKSPLVHTRIQKTTTATKETHRAMRSLTKVCCRQPQTHHLVLRVALA